MSKVLNFPEAKMKKAKRQQKSEAKAAMISLSMVSLILGALFVNDNYLRNQRPIYVVSDNQTQIESLNRAIASAQPMNPFRDLEWEREIAKKLGQEAGPVENRNPASLGRSVSSVDHLRFGPLAGKYRLVDQKDSQVPRISEINYVESLEVTERPVFIDAETFLKDYGALLSVSFAEFEIDQRSSEPRQKSFRLLNQKKEAVGSASFVLDEDGRFISLKIRQAAQ